MDGSSERRLCPGAAAAPPRPAADGPRENERKVPGGEFGWRGREESCWSWVPLVGPEVLRWAGPLRRSVLLAPSSLVPTPLSSSAPWRRAVALLAARREEERERVAGIRPPVAAPAVPAENVMGVAGGDAEAYGGGGGVFAFAFALDPEPADGAGEAPA